ncbi:hypothetical protein VTO73DRAFT_445 [Trametes versicolor]
MLAKLVTFATLLATVTAATAVSQASPTSQTSRMSRAIGGKPTRTPHAIGEPQISPTPAQAGGTPGKCTIGNLMCCTAVLDPNNLGLLAILGVLPVVPTHKLNGAIGVECNPVTADSVGCIAQLACCTGEDAVLGVTTFDCIPVPPEGPGVTSLPA